MLITVTKFPVKLPEFFWTKWNLILDKEFACMNIWTILKQTFFRGTKILWHRTWSSLIICTASKLLTHLLSSNEASISQGEWWTAPIQNSITVRSVVSKYADRRRSRQARPPTHAFHFAFRTSKMSQFLNIFWPRRKLFGSFTLPIWFTYSRFVECWSKYRVTSLE
jgi:hypothetical protein